MAAIKNLGRTWVGNPKKNVIDSQEDSPKTQKAWDGFNNDPFGLYEAIKQAKDPTPTIQKLFAVGLKYCLLSVILLPFLVFCYIIYFGVKTNWTTSSILLLAGFSVWTLGFTIQQLRLLDFNFIKKVDANQTEYSTNETIAVIGAGPVGLAVVKECFALGLNVTCIESSDGIGGVFRYDENGIGGVWKNLVLTTSPWITAFSDFPPKTPSSQHWKHDEYLDYLNRYVDHFGFRDKIVLKHKVTQIKKLSHGWEIQIINVETMDKIIQHFDRVVICSGLNSAPKQFNIPGIEHFGGEILSAAQYKTSVPFRDRHVCVVGLGESGADIATEISHVAKKAYISIKRGVFVIPRVNPLNGVANDYDTNRIRYSTPLAIRDWIALFRRRLCFWSSEISELSAIRAQFVIASNLGPFSQKAVKQDEFIYPVLDRKLALCTEIQQFESDSIIFTNGRKYQIDTVIFTHGFHPKFDFLDVEVKEKIPHPGKLFLNMFSLEYGDSIAFCGFARPAIGAIPPTGEMQARLFALIASGKRCLPTKAEMQRDIKLTSAQHKVSFPLQEQPHVVVNWIPYMDKLAALIGCRPNPWKLLMHPRLLWKVGSGPTTGATYRIHDETSNATSVETVMSLPRTHQLEELFTMIGLHFLIWPIGFLTKNWKFRSSNSFI